MVATFIGATGGGADHPTFGAANFIAWNVPWPAGTQVGDFAMAFTAYPDLDVDWENNLINSAWEEVPSIAEQGVAQDYPRRSRAYTKRVTAGDLAGHAIVASETSQDDIVGGVAVWRGVQLGTTFAWFYPVAFGGGTWNIPLTPSTPVTCIAINASGLSGGGIPTWQTASPGITLTTQLAYQPGTRAGVGVASGMVTTSGIKALEMIENASNSTLVVLIVTPFLGGWQVGRVAAG